ncbi:MAG: hypothetical protein ACT4PP_01865 [Sporichthyaceae bacterium]
MTDTSTETSPDTESAHRGHARAGSPGAPGLAAGALLSAAAVALLIGWDGNRYVVFDLDGYDRAQALSYAMPAVVILLVGWAAWRAFRHAELPIAALVAAVTTAACGLGTSAGGEFWRGQFWSFYRPEVGDRYQLAAAALTITGTVLLILTRRPGTPLWAPRSTQVSALVAAVTLLFLSAAFQSRTLKDSEIFEAAFEEVSIPVPLTGTVAALVAALALYALVAHAPWWLPALLGTVTIAMVPVSSVFGFVAPAAALLLTASVARALDRAAGPPAPLCVPWATSARLAGALLLAGAAATVAIRTLVDLEGETFGDDKERTLGILTMYAMLGILAVLLAAAAVGDGAGRTRLAGTAAAATATLATFGGMFRFREVPWVLGDVAVFPPGLARPSSVVAAMCACAGWALLRRAHAVGDDPAASRHACRVASTACAAMVVLLAINSFTLVTEGEPTQLIVLGFVAILGAPILFVLAWSDYGWEASLLAPLAVLGALAALSVLFTPFCSGAAPLIGLGLAIGVTARAATRPAAAPPPGAAPGGGESMWDKRSATPTHTGH